MNDFGANVRVDQKQKHLGPAGLPPKRRLVARCDCMKRGGVAGGVCALGPTLRSLSNLCERRMQMIRIAMGSCGVSYERQIADKM